VFRVVRTYPKFVRFLGQKNRTSDRILGQQTTINNRLGTLGANLFLILLGYFRTWCIYFWFWNIYSSATLGNLAQKNTPLVDPDIFKSTTYNLGLAGIFTFFAGFTGVYLIITLFLQIGQGYSARGAGIANIAIALGTAIGGALSGAVLAEKFGTRVLQFGAAAQIIGALLLFFALPDMQSFNFWHIAPGMLVSGFGTGLVVAALFDAILLAIKDELVGSASGVLSAIQSIASSVGVAIFGTVFFNKVASGQIDQGFRNALLLQIGLVSIFLVITFFLPKKSMDNTEYAH